MPSSIAFVNPGLIELRGVRAFGVNSKPMTDSPLGFFGTGLKHALAVFLRLGQRITLFRGLDRYTFGTAPVDMRGKAFSFVTLIHPDGREEELPYSTELGKTWEPWMAYRELHSNALDEKGSICRVPVTAEGYQPKAGETAILIEGQVADKAYDERNSTFLSTDPLFATPDITIHPGPSNTVFYRGVRVMNLSVPSLFTYNLLSTHSLTEDRTLSDPNIVMLRLARLIAKGATRDYLNKVLIAPDTNYEYQIGAFWADVPNDTFIEVYTELRKNGHAITLTPLANATFNSSHKSRPLPDPIKPSKVQAIQLQRAIAFCHKMGWPVDDYPIMVVPYARGGLQALAEDGKIILTEDVFSNGTKVVAAALFEEMIHLKYGMKDHTRELQTYLFNQCVTLGEQLVGEPL